MKSALPVQKDGPRINEEIRVREVQLIDASGHNHGSTPIQAALDMAQAAGLDLVEIAPNSSPPVCKILDYGKYKYQAQKKAAEARKKQKVVEIKEIKLRPMIDDHDYQVKMRSMKRFFEDGDKVKITLRFRGREMAHQELGFKLLDRVEIRHRPTREGRVRAAIRRPPDDHGVGPALAQSDLISAPPQKRGGVAVLATGCRWLHRRAASAITPAIVARPVRAAVAAINAQFRAHRSRPNSALSTFRPCGPPVARRMRRAKCPS